MEGSRKIQPFDFLPLIRIWRHLNTIQRRDIGKASPVSGNRHNVIVVLSYWYFFSCTQDGLTVLSGGSLAPDSTSLYSPALTHPHSTASATPTSNTPTPENPVDLSNPRLLENRELPNFPISKAECEIFSSRDAKPKHCAIFSPRCRIKCSLILCCVISENRTLCRFMPQNFW